MGNTARALAFRKRRVTKGIRGSFRFLPSPSPLSLSLPVLTSRCEKDLKVEFGVFKDEIADNGNVNGLGLGTTALSSP